MISTRIFKLSFGQILPLLAAFSLVVNGQVSKFTHPAVAKLVLLTQNNSDPTNNSTKTKTTSPVVFWHGMGDTARGSVTIERIALEKRFPGILVFSIQIGNNFIEDELATYFTNVNQQVQQVCELILSNKQIREAGQLNGIGFSQGAQFLRALVQRCPLRENGIKFKNLISLGAQHQGVFGLPNCNSPIFCDFIKKILSKFAYEKEIQEHLVQAEYWHDPLHEQEYRDKSLFIAEINNENIRNQTYKDNLLKLDNLVLVKFDQDDMVVPRESSHFEFYAPGQIKDILPLPASPIWTEDRLGLRQMNSENRLKFINLPGNHLEYHMSWFLEEIADKYLNN